jgi:hypothetical protein
MPQKDLLRVIHDEFKWSVSDVDNLVQTQFLVDGWLTTLNQNKDIGLGLRGLLELRPWLISTFPDAIAECGACQQLLSRVLKLSILLISIQGIPCTKEDCPVKMHPHCSSKWATRKAKCLECNTVWKQDE